MESTFFLVSVGTVSHKEIYLSLKQFTVIVRRKNHNTYIAKKHVFKIIKIPESKEIRYRVWWVVDKYFRQDRGSPKMVKFELRPE